MLNNNRNSDRIISVAKSARLDEARKAEIFSRIQAFMAEHPPTEGAAITASSPVPTPYAAFGTLFFSHTRTFSFIAIALVLILGGAGTALAARNALPGDPLYAVKTGINEKVVALLAVTPEQKAAVDSSQALERLSEANALAAQNKLSTSTKVELQQSYAASSMAFASDTAELAENGNVQAAASVTQSFDSALAVNVSALAELGDTSGPAVATAAVMKIASTTATTTVASVKKHLPKPVAKPIIAATTSATIELPAVRVETSTTTSSASSTSVNLSIPVLNITVDSTPSAATSQTSATDNAPSISVTATPSASSGISVHLGL